MRAKGLICGILAVVIVAGGCKKKYRDPTTDLHRAAGQGNLQQVQTLIAHGSSINAGDAEGRTPLHIAAQGGHKEVAEVLLRCGASIDSLDQRGRTPAMVAMEQNHRPVVEYLVHAGAAVNLHLAAYLGDAARVKGLIAGGADVNAKGQNGRTAPALCRDRQLQGDWGPTYRRWGEREREKCSWAYAVARRL